MKNKDILKSFLIYPIIAFLFSIAMYAMVYFIVLPIIENLELFNNSFNLTIWLLFDLVQISTLVAFMLHVSRIKKAKQTAQTKVIIIEKKKLLGVDGNFFYGVEDDNKEVKRDFYLNIYPFTKTRIGNKYGIIYYKKNDYYKGYIVEDEKLFKRLFCVFTIIFFVFSTVISLLL